MKRVVVMYDAHCSSTVCGPSRSVFLTGVHCYRTGVYGNSGNLKDRLKKHLSKTNEPVSVENPHNKLKRGKKTPKERAKKAKKSK